MAKSRYLVRERLLLDPADASDTVLAGKPRHRRRRSSDPGFRRPDNDNRPFGVTARIAWVPKPSYQLTLRTPLYATRN